MRKKIIAGNWKMNLDYPAGLELFADITDLLRKEVAGDQEVVVCPPFIHISALSEISEPNLRISIGAQNCHQENSGAFTGEISAGMLYSAGARYVIIGHSERRQYFQESDALLAQKIDSALKHHLTPIFCIGESLEQRNSGDFFEVLKGQIKNASFHLTEKEFCKLVIAYEPIWAIGTGLTASPEQAQEVHAFIRKEVASNYSELVADQLTILYGGSCNPKNASELFAQKDIDGGLIGGASLNARDFIEVIKALSHHGL